MTWSGGPGHINTFNTPGIVSRNNTTLNNKTSDAGMRAYYQLLKDAKTNGGVDSISQFNHPGKTFGTFADFAYYDALIDQYIFLVEVGNGEGQIGQDGYYPSYEEYIKALDKGWHVAPTNNQDNHKGAWGNANNARDVILAEDLTPESLYAAIREYKVYSTEDKNLELEYTVNGLPMGSVIPTEEVPETLEIAVSVYDPDASDSVRKVEVVANSGKVVHTWDNVTELTSGELTCSLAPEYTYYFIRVTQGDGDLAVTAPVWVGESLKLGITEFKADTNMPMTGEELTLTTSLFNGQTADATITSMTYSYRGGEVIGVDTTARTIAAGGTIDVNYSYTPDKAKVYTVIVTAVIVQDGKEYTFSKELELDVRDADDVAYIGVDASHYNEYVTGHYSNQLGNFSGIAAEQGIRVEMLETGEWVFAL